MNSRSSQYPRLRGQVMRVLQAKGCCFVKPLETLPSGYTLPSGKDIFFPGSANGGNLPAEDAIGTFTIKKTDRGIQVVSVEWEELIQEPDSDIKRFIHPYNFVSLPASGLGQSASVDPFRRCGYISHDRYDPKLHSGYIDCTLTTCTHWFIPHPDKSNLIPGTDPKDRHKVLGYFTLDPVSAWNHKDPSEDKTRPALPASSLRGMIRSVFETATLSCFSVFDPRHLDLRIAHDLKEIPDKCSIPNGRGPAQYIPARFLKKNPDGSAVIQLLNGLDDADPANTINAALIHAYRPAVQYKDNTGKKQAGSPTTLWLSIGDATDGTALAAIIEKKPFQKTKKLKSGKVIEYRIRKVYELCLLGNQDDLTKKLLTLCSTLKKDKDKMIVFGYLHRTGPNFLTKHHERLFFRFNAEYNDPDSKYSLRERFELFRCDETPSLRVESQVLAASEAGLAGYANRLGDKVEQDRSIPRKLQKNSKLPYPSDFVAQHEKDAKIKPHDLVYALIEQNSIGQVVRGLYPVTIPRLAHEDSRWMLLPEDFHPCAEPDCLCATCRVFGWVREPKPGQELKPDPNRVDAVAGHIRFTHAVLRGEWSNNSSQLPEEVILPILGSPKPTTTEFYLQPKAGSEQAKWERWPAALQTEQRLLYRQEEAVLRGQKYYRRRENVNPQSADPAANGLRRLENKRDAQNQTVHLLPPKMEFGFRVYFDNLTPEELGALLFSLSLEPPASWTNTQNPIKLRHALGHGKSLGMGACEIAVDTFHLDIVDRSNLGHRYAQIPTYNSLPPLDKSISKTKEKPWKKFIEQLENAWKEAEKHDKTLETTRLELLELLRSDPPNGPIHYPPRPDGVHNENYRWFVQNRKGANKILPSPRDERDPEKRLPVDPTSK